MSTPNLDLDPRTLHREDPANMPSITEQLVSDNEHYAIVKLDRSFKGGRSTAFKVDGLGVVTLLGDKPVLCGNAVSVLTAVGKNGAGSLTLTGARIGDKVAGVFNLTTPGTLSSSFETTITVVDKIQQSAATDLSAAQCVFTLIHQTPANS